MLFNSKHKFLCLAYIFCNCYLLAFCSTTPDYNEVIINSDSDGGGKQPVACYRCIPRLRNSCSTHDTVNSVPKHHGKMICPNNDDVCLIVSGKAPLHHNSPSASFQILTCASESDLRYLNLMNNGSTHNCQLGHFENQQTLQLFVPSDQARRHYMDYDMETCICNTDFCNTADILPSLPATALIQLTEVTNAPMMITTAASHIAVANGPIVIATTSRPGKPANYITNRPPPREEPSAVNWWTLLLIALAIAVICAIVIGVVFFVRKRKRREANLQQQTNGLARDEVTPLHSSGGVRKPEIVSERKHIRHKPDSL